MYATAWGTSFGLTLVAELPARGVTAPTLEQLDEPREVIPGASADQEMRMRLQEGERHNRSPLLESDLPKVLVEKRSRGRVDHRLPCQRGPREVEVDAVRRHGRARIVGRTLDVPHQRSVNADPVPVFPL